MTERFWSINSVEQKFQSYGPQKINRCEAKIVVTDQSFKAHFAGCFLYSIAERI